MTWGEWRRMGWLWECGVSGWLRLCPTGWAVCQVPRAGYGGSLSVGSTVSWGLQGPADHGETAPGHPAPPLHHLGLQWTPSQGQGLICDFPEGSMCKGLCPPGSLAPASLTQGAAPDLVIATEVNYTLPRVRLLPGTPFPPVMSLHFAAENDFRASELTV